MGLLTHLVVTGNTHGLGEVCLHEELQLDLVDPLESLSTKRRAVQALKSATLLEEIQAAERTEHVIHYFGHLGFDSREELVLVHLGLSLHRVARAIVFEVAQGVVAELARNGVADAVHKMASVEVVVRMLVHRKSAGRREALTALGRGGGGGRRRRVRCARGDVR